MAEMKEYQDVFPVPGKENRAVTVWVEEARDGKPHWYDFTEAEALKVDFDKAFPNGYVDYYIDIDKDGIIQSDTLAPEKEGTRFIDSYPNFKCKDNLYEEQQNSIEGMEKIEDAIQNALDALEVPANICIEDRDGDEPYFSFGISGIQKDESYDLSSDLDTLPAVSHEMEIMAIDYDANEERKLYTPGEKGAPLNHTSRTSSVISRKSISRFRTPARQPNASSRARKQAMSTMSIRKPGQKKTGAPVSGNAASFCTAQATSTVEFPKKTRWVS